MKKILNLIILLFFFCLYLFPMIFGLFTGSEDWKIFGGMWLMLGWIPLVLVMEEVERIFK